MLNPLGLIIICLIISCKPNAYSMVDNTEEHLIARSTSDKTSHDCCVTDSFVNDIIINGPKVIKSLDLISKPDFAFSSGFSNEFSFTQYRLLNKGNNFMFRDTVFNQTKEHNRTIFINNTILNVCKISDAEFKIDSMDLHIDYTESVIYTFKNRPNLILFKSHPMNWVGLMARFNFFQLINTKEKVVIEFIQE